MTDIYEPDHDPERAAHTRAMLTAIAGAGRLTRDDAALLMGSIMDGHVDPLHVGAIAVGLAARGEHVDEIAGFASAMRDRAVRVQAPLGAVDTCGTGGDGSDSFNVSTVSAFVVAACGVPVAKHGNRAVSSSCGSADLLESLGVRVEQDAASVETHLRDTGMGFMFAPAFHPAMRLVAPVRKALGVRTVFNLLGPLTNPAAVQHQVLGVARPDQVERLASVLAQLGVDRALVVHGTDGFDELSLAAPSIVCTVEGGELQTQMLDPAALGMAHDDRSALRGGDVATNTAIARAVLDGETGPRRNVVLLNAAAALIAARAADDFADGIAQAASAIDSGAAAARVDAFVAATVGSAERLEQIA